MNGETECARFLGLPDPAGPENLAHLLLPSLQARPHVPEWGGTPRSAPTPIKNALFRFHSKSGPDFSIFARSLLLPTPNERRDQMCQVFGLARPRWARKPGTFALSLLAPQQRQGQMCRNGGNPEIGPDPSQKCTFTKRIYHSKSGTDFSIFARSLFLPTPNERRDQMCQVFGLTRARGARKPGTFAPSLFAPQQRQGHMCWNGGNPEICPDPNQKRTFYGKNLSRKIWP